MSERIWLNWIGLPHLTGADPDNGEGIDCLVMCLKVRAAAGLRTPEVDMTWFVMAAAGQWDELEREWRRVMERCDVEPYGMLMERQRCGLGVQIVVDDGVLMVHHRRGCQWVPLEVAGRLMKLECWRPRYVAG